MTPEVQKELKILQLRAYMDPKRFYKKDRKFEKKMPKTFEVGTFIDDVFDEYVTVVVCVCACVCTSSRL